MKIKLLSVGKNKDSYTKAAVDEYLKRIKPYADIEIVYLPDAVLSGTNNPEVVIKKEGATICRHLDERQKSYNKPAFLICLAAEGKMHSSEELSGLLTDCLRDSEIILVIGGVYGLAEEVKKRADMLLSLSRLTFTHQMARIIILEQIYRAFTIISGKKYHY